MKQTLKEINGQLEKELAEKNRELKIETALEKVRARAMAMQTSEELMLLIGTLFTELTKLDLKLTRCTIWIFDEKTNDAKLWMANSEDPLHPVNYFIPFHQDTTLLAFLTAWKKRALKWEYTLEGEAKKNWDDYLFSETELSKLPDVVKAGMRATDKILFSASFNNFGGLHVGSLEALSEEHFNVLFRFAKVFEQTYTRFLDLKKAEAQAREAQIQLALERVRARAMAMHNSEELKEVVRRLFDELTHLDVNLQACLIATFDEATFDQKTWVIHFKTNDPYILLIPHNEQPFYLEMIKAWKERNHNWTYMLESEAKIKWEGFLFSDTDFRFLPQAVKDGMQKPGKVFFAASYYNYGAIQVSSPKPFSKESIDILQRFSKVFDSSYTRFLDLQKAEAQAREAEIELGLERVRSRSLAMHKSQEIQEVINEVFIRLRELEINIDSVNILIFENGSRDFVCWTGSTASNSTSSLFRYADIDFLKDLIRAKENQLELFTHQYSYEQKNNFFNYVYRTTVLKETSNDRKKFILEAPCFTVSAAFSKNIAINLNSYSRESFTDSENNIGKRFAKVFEQSYTRFLDLQKAEAQAREAQIEASLERIRSRTMGMQQSIELRDVAALLSKQLVFLGITDFATCGYVEIEEKNNRQRSWLTNPDGTSLEPFYLPLRGEEIFNQRYDAWKKKDVVFRQVVHAKELKKHLDFAYSGFGSSEAEDVGRNFFPDPTIFYNCNFVYGYLSLVTGVILTQEEELLLARLTHVFEQTYSRFLDLQKAEVQAKEATIEAGLERLRGKAMAMHTSRDLAETIKVFYHEMELLSVTPRRCGVGLLDKKTRVSELSTMNTTEEGNSIEVIGRINLVGHPVLEGIYDNWLQQKEYQPVLRGNEIKEYYQLMRPQITFPDYPHDAVQFGYFFYFPEGGVYAWTTKELGEDELKIYRRFTSVLSLTYKRYKDLTDAEARAKEAIKQASLDRVRGEIASMRFAEDLQRITPLIFKELTALGVPFFRCGVFIIDESNAIAHVYLSSPDGHSLAVLNLPFNSNELTTNSVENWRKGMVYHQHWNKEEFINWTKSMMEMGQIQNPETYQGAAAPPESLDLHFVPFTQGMLYVGNTELLSEDAIDLVKSLAKAFSIAYDRYEDFIKLEHAKQSIENTLSELKATQKQLIQSEKMASLGELTAGIAHEIQNPLNFVNNFSEVNKELLVEMKEEMDKGNIEDAKEIANDVIANSEKINHHGKRAGDIVKGMLQHSRTSTGVKEPTDINALADEYLRLSYHGLRAKDKDFNATMKTDFDETIGKINIIPQDIGRVLLNLYNNAFYAVNQQKSENLISYAKKVTPFEKVSPLYESTVSVTTKKSNNSVFITVSDNGNGIPQNIIDKIFQPFFTTKPTGSGTGLGLSLSYDIVKAHGGEIKVVSKENEGTEFIIQLPVV